MSVRYVMVRLTLVQANAASNASDLIADSYMADDNKREAAIYARTSKAIAAAIEATGTRGGR